MTRADLPKLRRVVVKIGTSLLAPASGGVQTQRFSSIARQVASAQASSQTVNPSRTPLKRRGLFSEAGWK